jgi:uncharacterized protein (TIGR03083 family)
MIRAGMGLPSWWATPLSRGLVHANRLGQVNRLEGLIHAWLSCVGDIHALLVDLEPSDWQRPTACPGWTVHDVVAHLAAIEHELATGERPATVPAGARDVVSAYTQAGVEARRGRSPQDLVGEFTAATAARADQLAGLAPIDPTGTPDRTPGGIGWDWQTLLRNRVIDVWVHEQDIRRATQRPGGMSTPAAEITTAVFTAALGYVIGKRVGAPPGTAVRVVIDDVATTYAVDENGRCNPMGDDLRPDVELLMDRPTFTGLAAGRLSVTDAHVERVGDDDLARRVLTSLTVTP